VPPLTLLSVIVPVYNTAEHVCECLDSLMAQTWKDFEVICIDDGSTDASWSLLKSYSEANDNIYCWHQENAGVSAARNAGLEHATGKFVTFIDSDDVVPPNAFKYMHQIAITQPADTICGIYERIDGVTTYTNKRAEHLTKKVQRARPDSTDIARSWSLCNKWLSRQIIVQHGISFESYSHLEDAVFLYSYLQYAQAIYTCPHIVYTYRKFLPFFGRTTTQCPSPELLKSARAAFDRVLRLTGKYNSPDLQDELLFRFVNTTLIGDYYSRLWTLDDSFFESLKKEIESQLQELSQDFLELSLSRNWSRFENGKLLGKAQILDSPAVAIGVSPSITSSLLPAFLASLYNQPFTSFKLFISSELVSAVPKDFSEIPNIVLCNEDPFEQVLRANAPYSAFIDAPMLYDTRALAAMTGKLRNDPDLDFVCIEPKQLKGNTSAEPVPAIDESYRSGNTSADRFLANKLFKTASIRDRPLDAASLFSSLNYLRIKKPAVLSPLGSEAYQPERTASQPKKLGFAKCIKRQLKKMTAPRSKQTDANGTITKAPRKANIALDAYLNDEIDQSLIVVMTFSSTLTGSALYLLRELSTPQYSDFAVALCMKGEAEKGASTVLREHGLAAVRTISMEEDSFKKILFRAGYIFSDAEVPWWWIKKPGQVYTNLCRRVPEEIPGAYEDEIRRNPLDGFRDFLLADYILLANDYSQKHVIREYGIDSIAPGKMIVLGYPCTGELLDNKERSRVRAALGLSASVNLIVWIPDRHTPLTDEAAAAFLEEASEALHPEELLLTSLPPELNVDYEAYERVSPFPRSFDTYEVLSAADVLITNCSSAMFDFAATKRKIVLYGLNMPDKRSANVLEKLPFPVADTPAEAIAAARADGDYDDSRFLELFSGYDNENNARTLCDVVIRGREDIANVSPLSPTRHPLTVFFSEGLQDQQTIHLLAELKDKGTLQRDDVIVAYNASNASEDAADIRNLLQQTHAYGIKGKPLSKQNEQQRLFGEVEIERVIVLDTDSAQRIKCFARFTGPVYLFVGEALLKKLEKRDSATVKAVKAFAKWGDGIFVSSKEAEGLLADVADCSTEQISTAAQLVDRLGM
jgi:glycosyltransferase involved in cell wall biosynthesis